MLVFFIVRKLNFFIKQLFGQKFQSNFFDGELEIGNILKVLFLHNDMILAQDPEPKQNYSSLFYIIFCAICIQKVICYLTLFTDATTGQSFDLFIFKVGISAVYLNILLSNYFYHITCILKISYITQ